MYSAHTPPWGAWQKLHANLKCSLHIKNTYDLYSPVGWTKDADVAFLFTKNIQNNLIDPTHFQTPSPTDQLILMHYFKHVVHFCVLNSEDLLMPSSYFWELQFVPYHVHTHKCPLVSLLDADLNNILQHNTHDTQPSSPNGPITRGHPSTRPQTHKLFLLHNTDTFWLSTGSASVHRWSVCMCLSVGKLLISYFQALTAKERCACLRSWMWEFQGQTFQ